MVIFIALTFKDIIAFRTPETMERGWKAANEIQAPFVYKVHVFCQPQMASDCVIMGFIATRTFLLYVLSFSR